MPTSKVKGDIGELTAVSYIQKLGYKILERNFRSKFGEIDIVAKDGKQLVFIEVKKRASAKYGRPEEAITKRKLGKIIKTINYFLLCRKTNVLRDNIRIDVIAILGCGDISLKHIKNVGL